MGVSGVKHSVARRVMETAKARVPGHLGQQRKHPTLELANYYLHSQRNGYALGINAALRLSPHAARTTLHTPLTSVFKWMLTALPPTLAPGSASSPNIPLSLSALEGCLGATRYNWECAARPNLSVPFSTLRPLPLACRSSCFWAGPPRQRLPTT